MGQDLFKPYAKAVGNQWGYLTEQGVWRHQGTPIICLFKRAIHITSALEAEFLVYFQVYYGGGNKLRTRVCPNRQLQRAFWLRNNFTEICINSLPEGRTQIYLENIWACRWFSKLLVFIIAPSGKTWKAIYTDKPFSSNYLICLSER